MKRIAIFHPVDDEYGASKILAYVVKFLSKKYTCDIYLTKNNKVIEGMVNDENVRFIETPFLPVVHRGMYNASGLIKWIKMNVKSLLLIKKLKKEYDLIYINTVALFSLSFVCRLLNVKNLVHCHEYLQGSLYGSIIKKTIHSSASIIVSVSNHVASYIGEGSTNSYVIYNGIPDAATQNSEPLNNGYVNFALVGRIMPEKGQWFLLSAMKNIPRDVLDKIKIHVYGDAPPTRKALMSKFVDDVKSAGLEDSIIIYGFDSAASEKIKQLDCCLVPSMMPDPFPTTVLEAMRASKIVVATNHGGAKEIIEDGINGFCINKNDSQQFALVLSRIATMSVVERKRMGDNARLTYFNNFTIAQFEKRFLDVLNKYL